MNVSHQFSSHSCTFRPAWLVIFLLAALLGGCGSGGDDDEARVHTTQYTAEYSNTDQPAQFVAPFSISDIPYLAGMSVNSTTDELGVGVYPITDAQEFAAFEQLIDLDLSDLTEYDFGAKDYFAIIDDGNVCGKLLRRDGFVKDDLFVYEVEYDLNVDYSCTMEVVLEGFLFEVAKAH